MSHHHPATLGPYRVERRLALGGSSELFEGTFEGDAGRAPPGVGPGSRVVLKRPLPHVMEDEGLRAFFFREMEVLGRVDHPGLVRGIEPLDLGPMGPVMVLEHLGGPTVHRLLAGAATGGEPADDIVVAGLGAQVASALSWLHGTGAGLGPAATPWVHRDVRPGNLVVESAGRVVLVDLGLAAPAGERLPETTSPWVAPELQAGEPASPSADLYALGLVLQALRGPGAPSTSLGETIAWCLERDPAHRPSSAIALRKELRHALESADPQQVADTLAAWARA